MAAVEEKVLERIKEEKNDIIKILRDLVAIPTQNPPGENYEEFTARAREYLSERGVRAEIVRIPDEYARQFAENPQEYPRFILLAELKKGKPTVHFNGHYDVVPAGEGWSVNPFSSAIINGRLYGRGASDMKGGVASIISMLRILSEFENHLDVGVNASLVPDEETTSMGTKYLLQENLVAADYAVIAEPTSLKSIDIGCKGGVWLKICVKGKVAHASRPWLGENAFEKGVQLAYMILSELKPRITGRVSRYDFHDQESRRATIELGGYVKGGEKINVIPGSFCFSIDRRVLPDEDTREAYREIAEFIEAKSRELGVSYEIIIEDMENSYVMQGGEEFTTALMQATEKITGVKPRVSVKTGFTEMALFGSKGIKALTFGPGDENLAHIIDEYIEIQQLLDAIAVYSLLLLKNSI